MNHHTNFVLERVTNPDIEVFTLAEMKRLLRTFDNVTEQDDEITSLIQAGREWCEDYTGRALIDQTWRLTLQGRLGSYAGGDIVSGTRDGALPVGYGYYHGLYSFGRYGEIMVRKSPALAITSFVSVDSAGAETAIDPTTYELRDADSKWPRIVALNGATWSNWLTGDLRITFRAGYADRIGSPQDDASVVPARYKQAVKLWCEANFNRDEKMMDLLIRQAENMMRLERCHLQIA